MSRKRQLPPDVSRWPTFRSLTHEARLLYLLLYTIADDEGRMQEDPGTFAYVLFPGETAFGLKIEACLQEIDRESLIGRYDVGRCRYLVISAWPLQKIDHPRPSKFPPPPISRPLLFDEVSAARTRRDA